MSERTWGHWGPEIVRLYRANAGLRYGPLLYRDAPRTLAVLDALGDGGVIGTATCIGQSGAHVGLWQLVVGGAPVEGLWDLVGGRFCRYDLPPPVLPPRQQGSTEHPPSHSGSGGSGSTGSQG